MVDRALTDRYFLSFRESFCEQELHLTISNALGNLKNLLCYVFEIISIFSFNTLVDMYVSCTDLLESKLFNSFCKLDKPTLEKKNSGSLYFL